MVQITIDQIKELRNKTGISMTACKKALTEAEGDMQEAIDLLRKKGEAKAIERSGREAGEGLVAVSGNDDKKSMILLACETDFVSRSPEYKEAAQKLADRVMAEGLDADLSGDVSDLGIKLGEKIELKEKATLEGPLVGHYIHSTGKIGVLLALTGGSQEIARDVAMHAAATDPFCVSPDDIDDEVVAKERVIWKEQLLNEGKPENIIDNILAGKEKKFREGGALLTQPFVKNPEQKINEFLGDLDVKGFVSFRI